MKIHNTESFEKLKIRPVDARNLPMNNDVEKYDVPSPEDLDAKEIVSIGETGTGRRYIKFEGYYDGDNECWELRIGADEYLDRFSKLDPQSKINMMHNMFDKCSSFREDFNGVDDFDKVPKPISLFDITEKTADGLYYLTDNNIY